MHNPNCNCYPWTSSGQYDTSHCQALVLEFLESTRHNISLDSWTWLGRIMAQPFASRNLRQRRRYGLHSTKVSTRIWGFWTPLIFVLARTAAALVKDLLTIAIDLSFQVIFDMDDHRAYHVKIKADKQGMISMECKKKKQQDGTVIAKAFLIGSKICNEENVHLSRAQRSLAQLPEARRLFDVLVESFQSS